MKIAKQTPRQNMQAYIRALQSMLLAEMLVGPEEAYKAAVESNDLVDKKFQEEAPGIALEELDTRKMIFAAQDKFKEIYGL